MRWFLFVLCITFAVLAVIRIIEMSIQFDGIDILWTAVFIIGAMIIGTAATNE